MRGEAVYFNQSIRGDPDDRLGSITDLGFSEIRV